MKGLIVDTSASLHPRLVLAELPAPQVGDNEVVVRVEMAGFNRADLALTADHYPPETIAGSELAGEVVEVGRHCVGFKMGDRVMALSRGSHAEFAAVDCRLAVPIPEGVSWQVAAALPAWYMTAHDALFNQGELRAGETVLIQGVTSGVGQAAAQLARLGGARTVVGVARSNAKLRQLVDTVVDLGLLMETDWPAEARKATEGRGANLVIDMVGGGALTGNLQSLAISGRLVTVGRLGGSSDTLDIGMLAFKRARLIGVTFRSRSLEDKAAIARSFATDVLPHVIEGRLMPRIDRIFPLSAASAAQTLVQRNEHFGKVLLAIR
ncbi:MULTISPECIES: zinc-binding dehydrogenase [unclassified Bradyrhizobium]|uniref:zinc-binding dehydrogenase n=1 Tax=unclassified Bradyrhizobium TaxID=2631580 RepID=UPI0033911139